MVLFSISFAWTISERINHFPKIRRFQSIGAILTIYRQRKTKRVKIKSDMFVLISSWAIILLSLYVSIELLIFYGKSLSDAAGYSRLSHIFFIPILFLLAPQLVSRLILSIVLWLGRFEIRHMFKNDRRQFDIFSEGWKKNYGLTEEGIRSGKIHKKSFQRSRESFLYLVLIFLVIFFITSPPHNITAENSSGPQSIQTISKPDTSLSKPHSQPSLPLKGHIANLIDSIDVGSWITAIATVILAVLTAIYVILTRNILKAQIEPCVILTVQHDENRPTILQLVCRNIGTGIAHDISFEFSKSLPMRAWGIPLSEAKDAPKMDSGPLIEGIPALGPGEERKIDWGQYGGLLKYIGNEPIIAKCNFKRNDKLLKPVVCKLDVKSFESTTAADTNYLKKASSELKRIADSIKNLEAGSKTLKIELIEPENTVDENE